MRDDWRGSGDWDDVGDTGAPVAVEPVRARRPRANQWSDPDKALMARLWALDVTADEIGKRLGRSKRAVLGQRLRLGLPKRSIETFQRAGRISARNRRSG